MHGDIKEDYVIAADKNPISTKDLTHNPPNSSPLNEPQETQSNGEVWHLSTKRNRQSQSPRKKYNYSQTGLILPYNFDL